MTPEQQDSITTGRIAGRAPDVPSASVRSGHPRTTTVDSGGFQAGGSVRTGRPEGASQARGEGSIALTRSTSSRLAVSRPSPVTALTFQRSADQPVVAERISQPPLAKPVRLVRDGCDLDGTVRHRALGEPVRVGDQ
jgi:hypothetical protein